MSVWDDDHIIPCAERSRAGRGWVSNSSINENKSLCSTFLICYPEMKMLHLGSAVGFEVLFRLSPPWLSSWKSINCHRYWEATSKGGVCQGHYQQGLRMRHLGGTEDMTEASLQTSSVMVVA